MSIVRAQISWLYDTAFPRDAMTINPHFENTAVGISREDWNGFAGDLAIALAGFANSTVLTKVKIYDAQSAPPNLPIAERQAGPNANVASSMPREVALCLSYYSDVNRPKYRGRLYVPGTTLGSSAGLRPSAAQITKCLSLGDMLKNAGGTDVDWGVWSRADNDFRPVSNFWVDDEWDTVRSRGLRSTTRQLGTASEAGP